MQLNSSNVKVIGDHTIGAINPCEQVSRAERRQRSQKGDIFCDDIYTPN